ncbi:MAG: TfoX/Sxy family protein [Actinobacteria bacterium]|nr:TfoX/Sxy family protein [Actinomycetota bacterium]
MAYDQSVDDRVAEVALTWGAERRRMFGGTCYLVNGNMAAGVIGDELILRLGEKGGTKAMTDPHVRPFDMTGKPMRGWMMVRPAGFAGDRLSDWLARAKQFAESLPPK